MCVCVCVQVVILTSQPVFSSSVGVSRRMDKVQGKAEVCRRGARLRPLLVALAASGQLYHTKDNTSSPPMVHISPPLAMWAAIVGLWNVVFNLYMMVDVTYSTEPFLVTLIDLSYMVTTSFYCIITATRSGRLARLLQQLEAIDSHLVGVGEKQPRVLSEPMGIMNMVCHVMGSVLCLSWALNTQALFQFIQAVMIVSAIMVTASLFRSVFILLAWDLQRALADARIPSHVMHGSGDLDLPRLQAMCLRVSHTVFRVDAKVWWTNTPLH